MSAFHFYSKHGPVVLVQESSLPRPLHASAGFSTFFLCINKINLGRGSVSSSKPSDSFPEQRPHQVQDGFHFPTRIICALRPEPGSVGRWMNSCRFHINGRVRRKTLVIKSILRTFPLRCIILHHINTH